MAKVNVVYDTLKKLANKAQQGFISPDVFNSFAGVAQLTIFNRMFDDLKDARRNRRAQFDPGRDKSLTKRIEEDLSVFARHKPVSRVNGVFPKPIDSSHIISATTFGDIVLDQSSRTPIELLYDEGKIDHILRSNVSAPSENYPVGLVSHGIEVFPESINKIQVRYYKTPSSTNAATGVESASSPVYGYVNVNGVEIYIPTNSYDFELPDRYTAWLVVEIAKYIGVNLRDEAIKEFAGTEQILLDNQQTFS